MANIDQEHNQDEEHQTNPGLDQQLLSALLASSMDFGNIGKPPASIVSIQELDEYEVDATFKRRRKEKNEETCAICSDEYELNQYVKQMPCKHFFHTDCLHEWLEKHGNSCPLCRKALGTLDYKYDEQQRRSDEKKGKSQKDDDEDSRFHNAYTGSNNMYS